MRKLGEEPLKETELKEDIINIQFKLVEKATYKTLNTFSFINLPQAKVQDNNIATLLEILLKLRKQMEKKPRQRKAQTEFVPYNKSILTRVIAEQL